jgi:long-chain acyl-CoA synthetase
MLTLTSAIDRARRLYGRRKAIVDRERTFTWNEFTDRVARAAAVLQGQGVKRGDRYAVLCRNTFRNNELLYAGYWMGAVPVPINYRLAPPEIRYILDNAGCKVLAVETVFLDFLKAEPLAPWRDSAMLVAETPQDSPLRQYEALMAKAAPAPMHDAREDDDAILLYTGGTTGRSKGVQLTHRNVFGDSIQTSLVVGFRSDDTYLHVAPMFHSADLLGMGMTLLGGTHAFLPQFTGKAFLEAIRDYRITKTMLTPTMVIMALQEPDFDKYDLSSLRQFMYGSSPMAVEWIRRALERFKGVDIIQGYGLTETSPILTILGMDVHVDALKRGDFSRLRAAGQAIIGVDLRILDEHDREVPTGEVGEVAVRGANVTRGYLKRPEDNAAAFRDGWFHTGDVGRVDEEGYLYLLDRKKDMIITGGENVYSSEVEAVIYQHPKVHECAVVGVPDDRYGEALLAAVVPAPGKTLTAEELIEHCRGKIGGYKIPRRMVILEQLPKSAMGKILKTELRRAYSGADAAAKSPAAKAS